VLDGSGTGQKVTKWNGSGTSNTLTDGPITFSSNDSAFAGDVTANANYTAGNSKIIYKAQRSGGAVAGDWSYDDATTDMSLGTSTAHSFSLKTGNTRALTINSSQDATFAGKIIAEKGVQFTGGTIASATTVLHTNNVVYARGGSGGMFLQNADGSDGSWNGLTITGSGTSHTQGAIVLKSSTTDTPEARGQGVFMFNEGDDVTWYMGTRYQDADEWQLGRKTGTSIDTAAAETGNALIKVNSAGNATFAGDVTLTNGQLTVTHNTNNAAKIIQTATSMSNNTYTFEVDSSSHSSNMSAAGAMAVDVYSGRAFTIAGNGNVGIGTSSPSNYNSYADNLVVADSDHSGISIVSGTTSLGTLMFADGTGGTAGYRGRVQYDHNTDSMNFHTAAAERMRIASNGNIGIGTTNPLQKLVVSNSTNGQGIEIVPGASGIIQSYNRGAGAYVPLYLDTSLLGLRSTGNIEFKTGSAFSEAMRITSVGKVGIGTTSPSEPLTVKTKTEAYFPGIKVEDYDSSMGLYVQNIEGQNSGIGTGRYYNSGNWRSDVTAPTAIRFDGGAIGFYAQSGVTADVDYTPTQRMNISSTGAIKFNAYNSSNNTGTPIFLLGTDNSGNVVKTNTIPGSGAGPYLPLSAGSSYPLTGDLYLDDGSGASPSLYFKNQSDNFWRYLMESGGDFSIKEGTSTRLTFQAGGNVGIGTINFIYKPWRNFR